MLELKKVADKSEGERVPMLRVAEVTANEGASGGFVIDPTKTKIDRILVNPNTPGYDHEPWPLQHVELVGDVPREHNFADHFVFRAMQDGYLEFTNQRIVHIDGYDRSPVITGDEIVLHLVDGDLVYKVLEHPGKHDDPTNEHAGYRITHEYKCELVKKDG